MRPSTLFPLFASVRSLKGVGTKVAPLIEALAGERVRDLLFFLPQTAVARPMRRLSEASAGEVATFELEVLGHRPPQKAGLPWRLLARDSTSFVSLVWFKGYGPHLERAHPPGATRVASGRLERYGAELRIAHPDYLAETAAAIPEIEPVYPTTAGLSSKTLRRLAREALARAPELPEWQDAGWIVRQRWPPWRAALEQLHAPTALDDFALSSPARRRLAFDELLAHQLTLGRRRLAQRATPAVAIAPSRLARAARAALPFSLTDAQERALGEITADLASGERMSRLVQGDVGSGKTVLAMLAMADVAAGGGQAALMAPTEILARQHLGAVGPALAAQGIECVLLTGRDKGMAREDKLEALASGRGAIAVGTHALFQDDVAFRRLRLAVIDEQHRFGVSERARLMAKGESVHLLAMSATPIPRTLELTMFGDMDVSRVEGKPPGRLPVTTRATPATRLAEVVERLGAAIAAGEQAFWICPMVSEQESADLAAAESRAAALRGVLGSTVGLVHGQLPATEKDEVMAGFLAGRLKALVATTVVEVGVDVPNASIMVIEQAERFGLAQLHQLRGRIGRGRRQSRCVLLYDPPLTDIARQRLDILRRTEDGFAIAEEDLKLRRGGDPLGLKQTGFPAWRLADPAVHADLIRVAADDARLILSRPVEALGARAEALVFLEALFDWSSARQPGLAG